MRDPFVIIGGDAAGMSAAAKAKRDDPNREVIAFEKGEWVSYAACGLPYYVKGTIDELTDLVAVSPEEFREERDIDLRTGHEVIAFDPDEKTVTVEAGTDQFEQPYGDLLIATGARPISPKIEDIDLPGIFTLRSMDEGDEIADFVSNHTPDRAAIVGGGYIGIEMAEALDAYGIDVEVFEMLPQILQPFGEDTARIVEGHLRAQGVELHLNTAVEGFIGDNRVTGIDVGDRTLSVDMVIVGVGVTPNVELAHDAGIETGDSGAIATDAFGQTNREDIYAAGDCAEDTNVVTGDPDWVPLGLTANRAGRAIGATVAGDPTETGRIAGTAIVKAFEFGAARTGVIAEERARSAGFDPISVTIEAPTRPHYYPGAEELSVTIVGDAKSGRVLGASVAGRDGVKRIDTVATALDAGMTVTELQNLDLAYAPPFSPVWDPILTAARVLSGKIAGDP